MSVMEKKKGGKGKSRPFKAAKTSKSFKHKLSSSSGHTSAPKKPNIATKSKQMKSELKQLQKRGRKMDKKMANAKRKAEDDGQQSGSQKKVRFNDTLEYDDDPRVAKQLSKPLPFDSDEEVSDEEVSEYETAEESTPKPALKNKESSSGLAPKSDASKVKTSKEAHADQKKIKEERRKKDHKYFELGLQAKRIWEEVRRDDCSETKRTQLLDQLCNLVKGHVMQIIRAHDTVRVVETIVQLGGDKHRTLLFDELQGNILELSRSKYSKFFVLKMLK